MTDDWPDAELVDNTVAALTLLQPLWLRLFPPFALPAHVRGIIEESAVEARTTALKDGVSCWCGTGGILVRYDPEDGQTTVMVQLGAKWDESEIESGRLV